MSIKLCPFKKFTSTTPSLFLHGVFQDLELRLGLDQHSLVGRCSVVRKHWFLFVLVPGSPILGSLWLSLEDSCSLWADRTSPSIWCAHHSTQQELLKQMTALDDGARKQAPVWEKLTPVTSCLRMGAYYNSDT